MSDISSMMLLLKGPSGSFYKTSAYLFLFGQYVAGKIMLPCNMLSYFQSGDVLLFKSQVAYNSIEAL